VVPRPSSSIIEQTPKVSNGKTCNVNDFFKADKDWKLCEKTGALQFIEEVKDVIITSELTDSRAPSPMRDDSPFGVPT
jgi:hypothetical protein